MAAFPTMWEATFWDIGGVIVELDSIGAVHRAFVESLIEDRAVETTTEEAVATWRAAVGRHFREREGTEFRLAEDAYHRGVESVLGESVERAAWRRLFDRAFAEHIEPKPDAVSTLESLADRDVHIGVLSDIDDREAAAVLSTFGLESTFDSVTTSEGVGRTKPDRRMFETALRKASATPSQSLMVGDRYDHDIVGAADAGIRTAAYGAESGPAVDFRVDDLTDVLTIVDGDYDAVSEE